MSEFEVRVATTKDVSGIQNVARESWHATYDDILGADSVEQVVDGWYAREGLEQSIEREDGQFLVAEQDGMIVGFAQGVLGEEDDAAHLPRIYVQSDHWGEGVGTELLGGVETWAEECGAGRLRLVVLAYNEVGNGFYEKHGYRVVAEREEELEGESVVEYVREAEL
ncbi:GNAT family N-acetyltransferase [Halorussus halophilus]|uniref:GNAT family N-acetyltransferase n=1 Tax=Halorussus halophilus TaxID=2650975 RepID=UPI0013018804|nr:GNAT family N-acetyltransferase [Halorussus halophilus]